MRILRNVAFALAGSVIFAMNALAHPGHENELGMAHVMTSFEHAAAFIGIGAGVAILVLARGAVAVIVANLILFAFVLLLGATHFAHGGALFAFETMIAGAALALGAWRAVHAAHIFFARKSRISSE